MIIKKGELVVVDMDECLCSLNSFRYWIVFSFLFSLFTLKWRVSSKLCLAVLLRVLRGSGRVQMKRKILEATEALPEYFVKGFAKFLLHFTNQDVVAEMRAYKDVSIVLCTAAPAVYVQPFAKNFSFNEVFATAAVRNVGWKENIGAEKLKAVTTLYGKNVTISCVITDHHDDLPLLLKANRRILVRPSALTLEKIDGKFEYETL